MWCDMHLAAEAEYWGRQYRSQPVADQSLAYEVDDPKHPDWVNRILTWAESHASALCF